LLHLAPGLTLNNLRSSHSENVFFCEVYTVITIDLYNLHYRSHNRDAVRLLRGTKQGFKRLIHVANNALF